MSKYDDMELIQRLRAAARLNPTIAGPLFAEAADEIERLRQIPVQVASICVEYTELVPDDRPFPQALEVVLARYRRALDLLRRLIVVDALTQDVGEFLDEVV